MREATSPLHQARMSRPRPARAPDSARDTHFDLVVFELAQRLRTPMALIAFVDMDRVWIKASVGFARPEAPLVGRFIAETVGYDECFVAQDARRDHRFADVGYGADRTLIRFYAGVEICPADGMPRGMLCAIDTRPRILTDEQHMLMRRLARDVEALILDRGNEPSQPH